MKKLLSVFLAISMLVGMLTVLAVTVSADGDTTPTSWDGTTATAFAGGTGTANDPYQISNGAELALMSKLITTDANGSYNRAYYKLTADIVLNEGDASTWAETAPANNFTPIGTWSSTTSSFGGTFDGDGHTISGLYVKSGNDGSIALFGCIQGGAVIKNLALVNSYVEATASGGAGAVIGQTDRSNEGDISITNVYAQATVKGNGNEVGGIIGNLSDTNSSFTSGKLTISKATFVGSVGGQNYVGGIIGNARNVVFTVSDCLVYAEISATSNKYASGIVARANNGLDKLGEAYKQVIVNCIVGGTSVTGTGSDHRAFISSAKNTNPVLVEYSYNAIADLGHARNSDTSEEKPCKDTTLAELYGKYEGETEIDWNGLTNWVRTQFDIARPSGIAESFEIAPITTYTVTWKNHDGTVLATESYETGDMPEYKGETPTKAEDDKYTYTFNCWDSEIKAVTGDATYTAEFYRTRKTSEEDTDSGNEVTDDFEPAQTTGATETTAAENEGGCGSVIGGGAVALVAIVGLGALGLKKKED